jgi:hypothetical protein
MRGFGGMVSIYIKGGMEETTNFLKYLKVYPLKIIKIEKFIYKIYVFS